MSHIQIIQLIIVSVVFVLIIVVATIVGFVAKKNGKSGTLWRQLTGLTLLLITGLLIARIYFINPLPSDEAMLENFNAHRAEYEELATGILQANKEGNESIKRWLSSERVFQLKKNLRAKDERNKLEKDQWFSGVRANIDLPGYEDKGSVEFWIEGGFKFSWREMNSMWKIYIYYPEVKPDTEGKLQCAVGSGRKCVGDFGVPLFESLNGYPQFYVDKGRNCGSMARKIDDHWYIKFVRAC